MKNKGVIKYKRSIIWLTQEVLEICKRAEKEWLRRLPQIIARGQIERERWREEEENRLRWLEIRGM